MSQGFRLPDRIRGPLSDEFFQIVGQLVFVTTLLERSVENLANALGDESQEYFARMSTPDQIAFCRACVPDQDTDLGERIEQFLQGVDSVREYRNRIVHSRWPGENWGWRPVQRKAKPSDDPGSHIETTETNRAQMEACLSDVVRLMRECQGLEGLVFAGSR